MEFSKIGRAEEFYTSAPPTSQIEAALPALDSRPKGPFDKGDATLSSRAKGPDWYYAPIIETYSVDESDFPFLKIQLIVR